MIFLGPPYLSELLKQTILVNQYPIVAAPDIVLDHGLKPFVLAPDQIANCHQQAPQILCNHPTAISLINKYLPNSKENELAKIFLDKLQFRDQLRNHDHPFNYVSIEKNTLTQQIVPPIGLPCVIKPKNGIGSKSTFICYDLKDWELAIHSITTGNKQNFPLLNAIFCDDYYIVEELIEGDEFAIDAYFNDQGKAVILGIYQHIFSSLKDIEDRIYVTNKKIIMKYLNLFTQELESIGRAFELRNFPVHLELRINSNNIAQVIEVNPLRFSGLSTCDLAYYAYGVNIYQYYFQQLKPNWNDICNKMGPANYAFFLGKYSHLIEPAKIKDIKIELLLNNFSSVLAYRILPYQRYSVYAIVFFKTESLAELTTLMNLDLDKYVTV